MEGSRSLETLPKHRNVAINTEATLGVSGKSWVTADNFDPEADKDNFDPEANKGCVGMALGRSTRCHRCQGLGFYPKQNRYTSDPKLENNP